jgi:hypothetical protein
MIWECLEIQDLDRYPRIGRKRRREERRRNNTLDSQGLCPESILSGERLAGLG